MSRSLHHALDCNTFYVAKHPAVSVATAAVFDRQGFGTVTYFVGKSVCTATSATVVVSLQSGSATSGHTLATTSEMIGTNTVTMTATTSNAVKFTYLGSDRYTSIRFDPEQTNATGALAILAIGAKPIKQPTSQTTDLTA